MKVENDFVEDIRKYAGVNVEGKDITEKLLNQIVEGLLCTIDDLESEIEDLKQPYVSSSDEYEYGY